jgi:uncharacterized cupin superfamily protein
MMQELATVQTPDSSGTETSFPPDRDIVVRSSPGMMMEPAPIEPSWILSGNPVARLARHSVADDKASNTALWDCTAGTFRWFFGWDETVYILDGEVRVTSESGNEFVLRAGDIAYFRAGTWATWRVDQYVRKIAFLRRPMPKPVSLLYRIVARLRGRSSGPQGL